MSSGYVFVTRGLLAMLDDEAELAAALGHELGHVSSAMPPSARASGRACSMPPSRPRSMTGSTAVGRSVAREGLLALRRYSREQELEADRAAVALCGRPAIAATRWPA